MNFLGFIDAFQSPYMQRALIIVVVIGVLGAVVGTHVILRRLTFLAESVQHTVLPGVAAAFVAGESIVLGAAIAALATVGLFALLDKMNLSDRDSLLALTVTLFLGLGVVIVSTLDGFQRDLTSLLFGRVLSTDTAQVVETAGIAIAILLLLGVLHKQLVFAAFDPVGAAAVGYRVKAYDLVLNVCIALTVVASVRVLGTVLVLAFIATPVVMARLLVARVGLVMALAAVTAVACGVGGLAFGHHLSVDEGVDVPAGALIVVLMSCALIAVAAVSANVRRARQRLGAS